MTDESGSPREADSADADKVSAEKVARLVGAALEAFAGAGLEGTRVDAIARGAGMNKRLLYHYVGDKAALFDAAANAAVERLLASEPPGDDPLAWRLLGHASAAGCCPDLTALLARLANRPPAELADRLLAGLLPEMVPVFRAPPVPATAAQPKPRIKLRPSVSPTVSRADGPGSGR